MSDIKQEIMPGVGGLNWDDDHRFMDKNDSAYRLNVITNSLGNHYVISNLLGNTVATHSFSHGSAYDDAVYTAIGSCYDSGRNSVYLFIHSSMGNDSIIRYNFDSASFDKICWDHLGLGLDLDYPIADAYMIGDWLHWNPRTTSPRAINVQWAYYDFISYGVMAIGAGNRSVGDYVRSLQKVYICTATIDDEEIPVENPASYDFVDYCYDDAYPINAASMVDPQTAGEYHKYRPFYNTPTVLTSPPAATVETDTDYEYNNIRGRRFQFCYRHYIKDQGYTVTSPFTDIIAPPSSETNKGELVGDIQSYNKIALSFNLGTVVSGATLWWNLEFLFEFAEILFREGPEDDWKVAERMTHNTLTFTTDVDLNAYCTVDFFNDRAYEVVDNVMVEKQYTPLPITSKAQWPLDGERAGYGGNVEGFDNDIEIDVALTTGEIELELSTPDLGSQLSFYDFTVTWNESTGNWKYVSDALVNTDGTSDGDVLTAKILGVDYNYTLADPPDLDTNATYAAACVTLLGKAGISAAVSGDTVVFYAGQPNGVIVRIYAYAAGVYNDLAVKVNSFKNGAFHPFCLYYYDDAGRRSEPVFNEDMRVYMETLPEALTTADSTNYQRYIDWKITHLPPQWAKYWRWGYAGNQTIGKFWQYNINSISSETKGTSADTWTQLDIKPLQHIAEDDSGFNHFFPDTTIEAYSYVPGDRVRFITDGVDSPADQSGLSLMGDTYDYEIKEYDDINHYLYIDELANPATTTTTVAAWDDKTIIIEIYRPKKQTGNTVYYEYGPLYNTYLDTGVYYHRGASQDQTESVVAEGQFTKGDVWVITRLFSLTPYSVGNEDEPTFVESYSWSDFHDTEGWGKGKTGYFTGIGRKFLNNIRYGNRFSPNTKTSGLSTFDFLDYKELSVDHGDITAMRQAGNTLKVYFERNSAAVLVGKQQLYDADGRSSVVKSDNVLGDAVYSNYHYGTIFPESVFLKDRTVFFYDIYRDSYIKDSSNGLAPISHNKMRRYFDEKSAALLTSGVSNVQVWSSYDYEYDTLMVHFVDSATPANDEVIMYHEPQDRWMSFLQIAGDDGMIFGQGSMKLVSFIGENLYVHNSNAVRNNLWGAQRTSIVDAVATEAPTVKKTFEALALHTNKPWDVTTVEIPADSTYGEGMISKVPEVRFRLIEGIFHSPYLRNMKTYSSTASDLDLVRGESLRGYTAEHRLVNDDTTEVTLFKIDVMCNLSRI